MQGRSIEDLSLHPYEKEIERYGGVEEMRAAEQFFCKDSILCLNLLHSSKTSPFPIYVIAAFGILYILKECLQNHDLILDLLSPSIEQKRYLNGARSWVPTAMPYIESILFGVLESNAHKDSLAKYISMIPVERRAYVANSLVHMHCNRLMGPLSSQEMTARVHAHYFLSRATIKRRVQNITDYKTSTFKLDLSL